MPHGKYEIKQMYKTSTVHLQAGLPIRRILILNRKGGGETAEAVVLQRLQVRSLSKKIMKDLECLRSNVSRMNFAAFRILQRQKLRTTIIYPIIDLT